MDIVSLREYCISKKGVEECFPFNETTLVFKVGGKMFLLVDIESKPLSINLKCEPSKAIELRETYSCVKPGYHMNKQHWNTVVADGTVSNKVLQSWIEHSYELVVTSLPKKIQALLK